MSRNGGQMLGGVLLGGGQKLGGLLLGGGQKLDEPLGHNGHNPTFTPRPRPRQPG